MSRIKYALIGLMILVASGCGILNKEAEESSPDAAENQAAPPEAPPAAPEVAPAAAPEPARAVERPQQTAPPAQKAPAPPKAAAPAPAAVSQPQAQPQPAAVAAYEPPPAVAAPEPPAVAKSRYAVIPGGINIQVRLLDPLDSGKNMDGDIFRAALDSDIEVDGVVVAPRGSMLEGKISNVERSGRVQGRAAMSLQLIALQIDGQSYPLQTDIQSFEAESTKKKDAGKVGIGAGLGALIGAIAGGGKGAAIGAAVGAGAGGATVVATRGDELTFDPEHQFTFILQKDASIKLQ